MIKDKFVCYECGCLVAPNVSNHFTSVDGKILCDHCAIDIEECSEKTKLLLIEMEGIR